MRFELTGNRRQIAGRDVADNEKSTSSSAARSTSSVGTSGSSRTSRPRPTGTSIVVSLDSGNVYEIFRETPRPVVRPNQRGAPPGSSYASCPEARARGVGWSGSR